MKTKSLYYSYIIAMLFLLIGCQSNAQDEILAEKNGYQLTKHLVNGAIVFAEEGENSLSESEKKAYTQAYIKEFLESPKKVLQELKGYTPKLNPKPEDLKPGTNNKLASGHQKVRNILGNDIGQMQFDSQAANNFRAYMANTLLTTRSNNYNSDYNSSNYSDSTGRIQFCANGTFVEALSGHISINVEGMSGSSSGTDYMPGYWEVAALPNGMFVILMYSTHSKMLEDSPNGLLPWVVPKHGPDFVSLPSGELYKRTPNTYCK